MRKLILLLLSVAIIFTIVSCSADKEVTKHQYTFQGENEDWTSQFNVDGKEVFYKEDGVLKYDSEAEKLFTLKYKHDLADLASIKSIKVSYKHRAGGGSFSETYNDEDTERKGTFTMKSGGKGGTIVKENEVIQVEINIDGETQKMDLITPAFQRLRGEYFDFAIENRLDYLPIFERGQAPTDTAPYLFYAFMINFANWGEDKGIMTKEYVEEVVEKYFKVENITHSSLRKGWAFDGEKYFAIPGGINEEPIYVLKEYYTFDNGERIVYHLTLDYCNYLDVSRGVEGAIIPSEEDMIKIREDILAGDLSTLQVLRTEKFSYYLEDNQVVFLSHTP